jgi:phosphonate degradation associated HDIG domain protein
MTDWLARIETLFATRGSDEYHGEAVSQIEHALQSAMLAETEGAPVAEIAAALLHDIGHLLHGHGEDAAERGIDDAHEALGQRFLEKAFRPDVTEPVRLHVAAKRYLAATRPEYAAKLSPASARSLELQGGPMSPEECRRFEAMPFSESALRLRIWDDEAKVPGLPTPPLAHYAKCLKECLR